MLRYPGYTLAVSILNVAVRFEAWRNRRLGAYFYGTEWLRVLERWGEDASHDVSCQRRCPRSAIAQDVCRRGRSTSVARLADPTRAEEACVPRHRHNRRD